MNFNDMAAKAGSGAKHAFQKAAGGFYWLFVEPHLEIRERNRDYRKMSRDLDHHTEEELIESINRHEFVKLGDVDDLLAKVNGRIDYNFSRYDFDLYIKPYFRNLERLANSGEIECRLELIENVQKDGRFRAGDLLDMMPLFEMPDGEQPGQTATEQVAVPVEQEFDETTLLGRFQRYMNDNLPLRTPSVDVTQEMQHTQRPLNIKRPLLLAIKFAAEYRPKGMDVVRNNMPSLSETRWERQMRENRPPPPRYYRGHRID